VLHGPRRCCHSFPSSSPAKPRGAVTPYTKHGKKHRLSCDQLFDVSNLLEDGSVAPLDSHRAAMNRGNSLFHVDSSFNPRRAGYSLLRAHQLPPKGTGGSTEFADTRTAYEELPEDLKRELIENDYVACHSLYHSRKTASPGSLPGLNPEDYFMSRHKLIQRHEPSGRMNLYIASHVHHIEGVSPEKSKALIDTLYAHACNPKYVQAIEVRLALSHGKMRLVVVLKTCSGPTTPTSFFGTTPRSCTAPQVARLKGNTCAICGAPPCMMGVFTLGV